MDARELINAYAETGTFGVMIARVYWDYRFKVRLYEGLYCITRIVAGVCAFWLVFGVDRHQPSGVQIAIGVALGLITLLETLFNPKDRWVIYAKASDLIVVGIIKSGGHFERFESLVTTVQDAEDKAFSRLVDLKLIEGFFKTQ